MDTSSDLLRKILELLSERQNSIALEELTFLVSPISKLSESAACISSIRNAQSRVLDALIILHDLGYIFLDPVTDYSCITFKGLLKTGSKAHYN